jgi:putative Mn2+ efflux pump MntP
LTLFGKYIEIYFTQNIWNEGSFLALVMLALIGISVLVPKLLTRKEAKVKGVGIYD